MKKYYIINTNDANYLAILAFCKITNELVRKSIDGVLAIVSFDVKILTPDILSGYDLLNESEARVIVNSPEWIIEI